MLHEIGPILFLLTLGGAAAVGAYAWARHAHDAWREVGRRLGLDFIVDSFWSGWELSGKIRTTTVRVKMEVRGKGRSRRTYTVAEVRPHPGVPFGLRLEPMGLTRSIRAWVAKDDVLLGDPVFDPGVHVQGPELEAHAALDVRSRRRAVRFMERWGGLVTHGGVEWERLFAVRSAGTLEALILDMVGLAESLASAPAHYPRRLAENLKLEPDAGVRRRIVELLLTLERTPGVETALAERLEIDPDAGVRALAAEALGSAGVDGLRAVVLDRGATLGARSHALEVLPTRLSGATLHGVLNALLAQPPGPLTPKVLAVVARTAHPEALPGLMKLVGIAQRLAPESGRALAAALGQYRDAAVEPALLMLLTHESVEIRRAAARALGSVGSLASVIPLREAASGLLVDRDLDVSVKWAVGQIQGRAGASAGQISLAATEDTAGQVSLAEPEAPRGALRVIAEEE